MIQQRQVAASHLGVFQKIMKIKHYPLILISLLLCSFAAALEDTPENRREQAIRYSKTTPLEGMFEDMADQLALNLPAEERQGFIDMMTKHFDIEKLQKELVNIMVRHFTADELKALADFYGSDVGKSSMSKIGAYMADSMPIIQAEVMKARAEALKAGAENN